MIPNKDKAIVQGHIPGRSVRMTFDPNAVEHILSILTDMYSDTELAVVRELSTNARDSHVEAGNDAPIEVTTPSALSPYLTIVDHGVGLSVDELHDLYSKYGASTKRGTNDATGMLGIGSKSPLTYTSQFTLTAVKDGVRATVSISRDEDGVGNLTVVDTAHTDEPNGVLIQIPVKAGNSFEVKAKKFFQFWQSGTVLLNGQEPSKLEGLQITDSILLLKHSTDRYGYGREGSVIVMGNVPYPALDQLSAAELNLPWQYSIVAHVPIGAVDFAPSREALQFTSRTKQVIAEIAETFKRELPTAIEREVQKAATLPEAVRLIVDYRELRGHSQKNLTWRGQAIPDVPIKKQNDGQRLLAVDKSYGRFKHSAQKTSQIDLYSVANAILVTDYDEANFTPTHKKKYLQWLDKQNTQIQHQRLSVWTNIPVPKKLLYDWQLVSWQTIKAEKLDYGRTVNPASGRIQGSYDLALGTGNPYKTGRRSPLGVPGNEIDQTKPVYWHHGNYGSARYLLQALDTLETEYTVVLLSENRLNKFRRDYPKFEKLDERIERECKVVIDRLSSVQQLKLAIIDNRDENKFAVLMGFRDQILDPEIRKCIDALKADVDAFVKFRRTFYVSKRFDFTNPLDAYALFDPYKVRGSAAEVVRYLNSEYQWRKDNK